MDGESILRGMLVWAQEHWKHICEGVGMEWLAGPPVYGTVWRILALVDLSQLERALSRWVAGAGGGAISVDGKSLRGSRRRGELLALQLVVAAAQGVRPVLGREGVAGGRVTEAALSLLQGLPLKGKMVGLDAGLNQREVAQAIWEWGTGSDPSATQPVGTRSSGD